MKTRFNLTKKLISILLVMALLFAYLPIATLAATPDAEYYNRVTDDNTMNNWVKYFDINEHGTANAGGVWTDKSVFKDADAFDGKVSMIEEGKNFLTALSTIAANKEIVGYSTVPTDTVLVLDLSRSISDQNAEDALIAAANDAIESLLKINKNNRVGVVLYSGSSSSTTTYENAVTRILEIDHYTTTTGTFLDISRNNNVTVNSGVRGSNPAANLSSSKSFTGYTYMQSGLWEAWKMFEAVPDITVGDNNWQSGDHRMPIVVLMTDGEPSQATTYYNDVENSQYTSYGRTVMGSNIGNGYGEIPIGQGFLVQLTASYIKSRIENKYQVKAEKGAGRSLFYTLGFEVDDMNVAQAILDPTNSTSTDEYWSTYSALTGNETMSVRVRGRTGSAYNTTTVNIAKDSYVKDKNYVDAYFSAESGQLENAFKSIVDEIIIQSRYYPTHLEGGSPDFAGYVEFTDTLGEYMEVKHINGILLGDTLFDGNMMASKLADTSAEGLGSIENPTELGDEFINAVKTRLGIENTVDAQLLEELNAVKEIIHKYNAMSPADNVGRLEILKGLLGHIGDDEIIINQPFYCDYGKQISVGKRFFANFHFTVLDEAKVTIGDDCFIGPNVSIYTACHSTDPVERNTRDEWAEPVTIGNNVWIGGSVTILPGVTVGDNVTIGAGSVVTKNIPSDGVAVGNPCRVIKKLR